MNQVQELIQAGIQNEMAAWSQSFNNENTNPNIQPHTLLTPSETKNSLSEINLDKLAALLKPTMKPTKTQLIKTYTGIAQGVNTK